MEIHEIDQHVDEHLENLNSASLSSSNLSEQQLKLVNICNVLHAAKPVLKFARGLLFWKPKWQQVIDRVIDTIDEVCPV